MGLSDCVFIVLPEDPGSLSGWEAIMTTCNCSYSSSNTLFWFPKAPAFMCIHLYTDTHTCILKNKLTVDCLIEDNNQQNAACKKLSSPVSTQE